MFVLASTTKVVCAVQFQRCFQNRHGPHVATCAGYAWLFTCSSSEPNVLGSKVSTRTDLEATSLLPRSVAEAATLASESLPLSCTDAEAASLSLSLALSCRSAETASLSPDDESIAGESGAATEDSEDSACSDAKDSGSNESGASDDSGRGDAAGEGESSGNGDVSRIGESEDDIAFFVSGRRYHKHLP